MRLLLNLLSFVAIMLAPLAAPAQATVSMAEAHCTEMPGMEHHPVKKQASGDSNCCVAAPVALPPADLKTVRTPQMAEIHLMGRAAQLVPADFEAEDPPPRT